MKPDDPLTPDEHRSAYHSHAPTQVNSICKNQEVSTIALRSPVYTNGMERAEVHGLGEAVTKGSPTAKLRSSSSLLARGRAL